ncbi:hypothetical protein [Actibacterium pelagium]|nr:hypothetical protein [Actibacterium pelagium]
MTARKLDQRPGWAAGLCGGAMLDMAAKSKAQIPAVKGQPVATG